MNEDDEIFLRDVKLEVEFLKKRELKIVSPLDVAYFSSNTLLLIRMKNEFVDERIKQYLERVLSVIIETDPIKTLD